jgi:subtilisin-like proprotein convertase family protein
VVTLPYQDNFFIPIATPFELTGSATDMDGDPISYCWEEVDAGPETPLGQPVGNAAIFRTRPPVDVTNRYFPRLGTVISNGSDITEQLPTYSRDLTFRLSARDNKLNGGGVGLADVAFKAYEGAGPFTVSSPNTTTTIWHVGEYTEVSWNVANTNVAPVNCKFVNIRLSTDGGQTYPITLASGVPNDGSQYILVPNNVGSTMRVRIDAAENVFFDISNANFKIQLPAQPSLTLGLSKDGATICLPDQFATDILSAGVLGYSDPILLELEGDLPPGATATFSSITLLPGASATFSVDLSQVMVEGIYTFNIRATSGAQELIRPITLSLLRNDFTGFNLQAPNNGLTGAALTQTLRWSKGLDADAYDVEFSLSPSFSNILASKSATSLDSFKISFLLQKGTAYFWRVRPLNACGKHDWSEPFFFSTYAEDCRSFESNDLPKNLSANGTPSIETKITVNQGGIISDVNVKQLDGFHAFFKDLEVHLISPTGTDVMLWKDKCGNFNGFFNFGLDDAAPGAFPCPPNNSGIFYRPQNPMTPFVGQSSTGAWTLRVKDNVVGSGGTLEAFQIEFCATLAVTPPFLVNNNVMPLPPGTSRVITPDFLLVEDIDNTHAELQYTVMTEPEHGYIDRQNVGMLHAGDTFTQANLDAGEIRFFDYGAGTDPDGFRFMVTDHEGGYFGAPKFVVQPFVGTREPNTKALDFLLFPNPATETVQLAFGQALTSDAHIQLFDLAGRQLNHWTLDLGASALNFNVQDLPKGIYLLSVNNEEGSGLKKLVVQ